MQKPHISYHTPHYAWSLGALVLELAMDSHVGGKRTNDDACGHWAPNAAETVFAVADGAGSGAASRLAVDTTLQAYREGPAGWSPGARLHWAVQEANVAVHTRARALPELGRIGTALTAAVVRDGTVRAVHVGDTRLYLVRGAVVLQLTKDHNIVNEGARLRLVNAEDARSDPESAGLTMTLGQGPIASVDRLSKRLVAGDRLVACTDGLHSVVVDEEFGHHCRGRSVTAACRSLLATAKRRSPTDNLTVAVLALDEGGAAPDPEARSWRTRLLRSLMPIE